MQFHGTIMRVYMTNLAWRRKYQCVLVNVNKLINPRKSRERDEAERISIKVLRKFYWRSWRGTRKRE